MKELIPPRYQVVLVLGLLALLFWAKASFNLAEEYAELAEADTAAEYAVLNYEQALKYDSQNPAIMFGYAEANKQAGNFAAALDAYQQALEFGYTPTEEIDLGLGWVEYALGDYEAARAHFESAVVAFSNKPQAIQSLSSAYAGLGWVTFYTDGCETARDYFHVKGLLQISELQRGKAICP